MGILYAIGSIGAALIAYAFIGRRSQARRELPGAPPQPTPTPDPGTGGQDVEDREWADETDGIDGRVTPTAPGTPASHPTPDPESREPGGRTRDHEIADDETSAGPPGTIVAPPKMQEWAALLAGGCAASGIQLPFALRWIEMESGGNPCAIGYPASRGPDGNPLEIGFAQLYNPDDFSLLDPALTGRELRAYCVPGDRHDIVWKGKVIKGFSSTLLRPLTPQEMRRQADSAIRLIARSMRSATRDLVAVGAGPAWSTSRRDYWRLVKLQHGLPAISRDGLPAVARQLGRAPRDWAEFTQVLDRVKLNPKIEAKYRSEFPRILANAVKCASVISERAVG